MSKICKSCGEYYDGEYCTKCGYGNKSIKVKSVDKYKKRSSKGRVNNSSIYDSSILNGVIILIRAEGE